MPLTWCGTVVSPSRPNQKFFGVADTGIPDGIKCDMHGNVYSGCGDGLNIWSAGGVLMGKILVDGALSTSASEGPARSFSSTRRGFGGPA